MNAQIELYSQLLQRTEPLKGRIIFDSNPVRETWGTPDVRTDRPRTYKASLRWPGMLFAPLPPIQPPLKLRLQASVAGLAR